MTLWAKFRSPLPPAFFLIGHGSRQKYIERKFADSEKRIYNIFWQLPAL